MAEITLMVTISADLKDPDDDGLTKLTADEVIGAIGSMVKSGRPLPAAGDTLTWEGAPTDYVISYAVEVV